MQSFYLPHREWVIRQEELKTFTFQGSVHTLPPCCPPTVFCSQALCEFVLLISLKVADKALLLFIHSKFLASAQTKKKGLQQKRGRKPFFRDCVSSPLSGFHSSFFRRLAIIPSLCSRSQCCRLLWRQYAMQMDAIFCANYVLLHQMQHKAKHKDK